MPPKVSAAPPVPLHLQVQVSDLVLWFPGGDPGQMGQPAIVTKVCHGNRISCSVFHPDLRDAIPQEGVPHMDDPHIGREGYADHHPGGWRLTEKDMATRRLMVELGKWPWPLPPAEAAKTEAK